MNDFRLAFRSLAKTPRFALLAIAVLAVGIAGNTVVFSLVNGLFLRPLPFPEADRLVDIDETAPKWGLKYTGINYEDFEAWRSQNKTFAGMATWRGGTMTLSDGDRTELVPGQNATNDLADVLGISPILGRMFTREEELKGAPTVVLIGHHIWREWFDSDPSVLGRAIKVDSQVCEIIGVLPETAVFPSRAALWLPFVGRPRNYAGLAIGRLKEGVTPAQAATDLQLIHKARIAEKKSDENTSPIVQPLLDRYLGDGRSAGALLQFAVAVLLLIACANVAGLMLARTLGRLPELGVRSALGASRWRIVRQLMAESAVLTACGAGLGVLLGRWMLSGWLSSVVEQLPAWVRLSIDARFVFFVSLMTVVCAALSGLVPARHVLRRIDLQSIMGTGAQRGSLSGNRLLSLRALVVGELALSLVLLLVASLLGRAFLRVQHTDPGLAPDRVLTYGLILPGAKYKGASRAAFFREHIARVRALPEVESASGTTALPFSGTHVGNFFEPEGGLPGGPGAKAPVVLTHSSFEDYFVTMGIAFTEGRAFAERDGPSAVVVNQTLARLFWPGVDAVGKRLRTGAKSPWLEVVGVVRDVRHYGLENDTKPEVYIPFEASPASSVAVVVRAKSDPGRLPADIRTLVKQQDPNIPLDDLATMERRIQQSLFTRRLYSSMTIAFALIACAMAVTGLYGLISYVVGQRTREFGIRLALGALPKDLSRLVLREGVLLATIGGSLGLVLGGATSLALSGMLLGVSPFDPLALLGTLSLLVGIVCLACLSPARRAVRVNPADVLRSE